VIERELLSGLRVRRIQKPLANMVIRGPGPNLPIELGIALNFHLVFPTQICPIILPIQIIGFSHLPVTRRCRLA